LETDWAERLAMQHKAAAKEKIFLILLFIHTSIKFQREKSHATYKENNHKD